MLYRCNNCGQVFEQPKCYEECVGDFWGSSTSMAFEICPYCDDEDFHEITCSDLEEDELDEVRYGE